MTDLASNLAEFTVSELSASLKRTVEDAFGHVRLRGEISGFRGVHSSGHCYFSLKDDNAKIDAVCWRGTYSKLSHKPEEGLEVVVTGRITTYANRSSYQIVIDSLEPAGAGALMALLEERKKKLAAEGLFAAERKRELPWIPDVVGVVTSPTGSVIRDILHRLADRFPRRVLVWPVRVQGETSAAEVAAAIAGFNALEKGGAIPRPDVIIVARGGGSIEELWGFNEEIVVRAAAESAIPLISAVGHETDWTLIDMAADVRAPTPTAAAEMAVPVRAELLATVDDLSGRMRRTVLRRLEAGRTELRSAARALPRPADILAQARQRFDAVTTGMAQTLRAALHVKRMGLTRLDARITPAALKERIRRETRHLQGQRDRLAGAMPRHVERFAARLDASSGRFADAMPRHLERWRARLDGAERMLNSLSYKRVLRRGYALVRDDAGTPLQAAAAITPGMALDIEFADGNVPAIAGDTPPRTPSRTPSRTPAKSSGPAPAQKAVKKPGGQGSLF